MNPWLLILAGMWGGVALPTIGALWIAAGRTPTDVEIWEAELTTTNQTGAT